MSAHADELQRWIRAFGLDPMWRPLVHTTLAWIASAAPPWASESDRALACMDLGTCFFVLDDSPPDDALARYSDLERILGGAPVDPGRPLQRAYAALFPRLGADDHYRASRRTFVAALRVRHAMRAGELRLDAAGYLALRETTIYFACWLSTWELLGGFALSAAERAVVQPAFVPANRWQVLENARVSLARDARSGTPNVIAMVAAERGVSLATADTNVAARAADDLHAYRAAAAAIRARPHATAIARYLDLVDHGVAGAMRHHADPARYHERA